MQNLYSTCAYNTILISINFYNGRIFLFTNYSQLQHCSCNVFAPLELNGNDERKKRKKTLNFQYSCNLLNNWENRRNKRNIMYHAITVSVIFNLLLCSDSVGNNRDQKLEYLVLYFSVWRGAISKTLERF